MSLNTSIPANTCGVTDGLARTNVALADCLEAAVLVTDCAGAIHTRNQNATRWLSGGDTLDTALAGGRFLEPFCSWGDVVAKIVEGASLIQFEGALKIPGQAEPELVTIRCTPYRDHPAAAVSGCVILLLRDAMQQGFERRLEVSTRLACLGKLAARVAHELNNPLDGILRYINLSLRVADNTPAPKLKDYLAQSRTGLMRMVPIIGDLLEYSRGSGVVLETMGINRLVEQAMDESEAAAGDKGITITLSARAPDLPHPAGGRIHQICGNLLRNAVDATPTGGRITVTTDVEGSAVVIRVSDTGCGLSDPPDKVFEPFFTTKPPGEGTGLGLAICRDFINDIGGRITAATGEHGGAVFTLFIPHPVAGCNGQPRGATRAAPTTEREVD